jgi:GT2 family glycosyltransferase
LQQGKGDNVGGVWEIRPAGKGWIARSIAAAAAHPFGVGDALYRFTHHAGAVDTVPFGAFRRSLFEQVGHFDESLLTNEDYEFNTRIRQHGGVVWLDPAIRSVYFARSGLGALARQYWRYGFWKLRMLRRYPGTLRWRQALPPLFVLSCLGLALLSSLLITARLMLVIILLLYFSLLVIGSLPVAYRQKDPRLLIGIPLAIATMHVCWGAGFLRSLID